MVLEAKESYIWVKASSVAMENENQQYYEKSWL